MSHQPFRYINKLRWIVVLAVILTGCNHGTEEQSTSIQVAAASDLYFAFSDISEQFADQTGIDIQTSFHSSGQLSHQIKQGAPYDLFAAADESFIDELIDLGAIGKESKKVYAHGKIGWVYSESLDPTVDPIHLLKNNGIQFAIANPRHAPYGRAASSAIAQESSLPFQPIDADTHEPIIQALGIPDQSNHQELAQRFADFIMADTGQHILSQYDFELPQE